MRLFNQMKYIVFLYMAPPRILKLTVTSNGSEVLSFSSGSLNQILEHQCTHELNDEYEDHIYKTHKKLTFITLSKKDNPTTEFYEQIMKEHLKYGNIFDMCYEIDKTGILHTHYIFEQTKYYKYWKVFKGTGYQVESIGPDREDLYKIRYYIHQKHKEGSIRLSCCYNLPTVFRIKRVGSPPTP